MSSLLNKLKSHGGDKHHDQTGTVPTESYNHPSSNTGYNNTTTAGYGNTTSPTQNTSSGYDNGPLNSHSDGGRYFAPKGTAVGQGHNNQTVGPHSNDTMNKLDPRVDSDQSRLQHSNQPGYGQPGYNQGGYDNRQSGYVNTTQGPHSSNLANKADPRVDSDNSRANQGYGNTTQGPHSSNLANRADPRVDSDNSKANHGYGTTTTTTTNTSTSVGHEQYGVTHGTTRDGSKQLPKDPNHPTLLEKANPKVNTDASRRHEYDNAGYGNDAGSNQYGSTHESNKRLPENPNHPTMTEKANPNIITDASRRHEQGGYPAAGYSNTTGTDKYDHDSTKKLPKDPNHPTTMEKINPQVNTDSSRRNEYDNTGYGNASSTIAGSRSSNLANRADPRVDSDMESRRHGHNDQYATGAAGAYGATESSRHHAQPVRNDDNSMINRSHPHTSMHPSDKRYDSNRADQQTGPDGEYLPGPAPTTAGPHKSDMLNKLDPRVDSDQSKLEKEREREREGYGNTRTGGTTYGNEHERRINEGRHYDQYSSNSPNSNRDSGYGGQGSNVSTLPSRKPVNETGSYGNDQYDRGDTHDQYSRGNEYDRSNQAGTYNNPVATNQSTHGNNTSTYGNNNEDQDFECAKCGHKNTHLRKNKTDQYGNSKPGLMDKLNPKVDSNGDGQAGFMK